MPIITLTSDLGTKDFYSAIIKGTIISALPDVQIVDITHHVPDYDSLKAAEILRYTFHHFPPETIHCILINTSSINIEPVILVRYQGHYFIGPDNGIFSMLFDEPPEIIIELHEKVVNDSLTFPFRDYYLPYLKNIILHKNIEKDSIVKSEVYTKLRPEAFVGSNQLSGNIWHIDKFGNAISNIRKNQFESALQKRTFILNIRGNVADKIVKHYSDGPDGKMILLFNSMGLLEIAMKEGNASKLIGINRGDRITFNFT